MSELAEQLSALSLGLNTLDLFCGCGGLSKGLSDAGFNIIAGIDIWDTAIKSYSSNFKHLALCRDLSKYSPEEFKIENNIDKPIDVIVGGPPCQSYSISGKRDENDPRGSLFMEFVKYLDYFQPSAFIMENVVGILSAKTNNGNFVIEIIIGLLTKNYNCTISKLYASDFEVPQNRRRVIIFGIRKDLRKLPSDPIPITPERPPVSTILLPREVIDPKHYLSEKAISGILKKKAKSKEEGNGFGAQFLDLDKPSYTISARYWKDGYDALVKYSDTEIRRLTIEELKRIQSFPNDYIILGNRQDTIMQIGNAVACRFAYHLGRHLLRILQ